MLRSRVGLSCLIASILSLSACASFTTPVAQQPTRVPVIYSSGPSTYSHEVLYSRGYYGHGYHGYKHCYRVKGYYHHGKFVKKSYMSCRYGYGKAVAYRGYYGCTGYIPAYAPEDRVCSKWEWMPGHSYGNVMYK